jgi:hypothetical protein
MSLLQSFIDINRLMFHEIQKFTKMSFNIPLTYTYEEKTGSVIYVQEENCETSITIFLNVLNLLMKENFILILSTKIDIISVLNLLNVNLSLSSKMSK